MTEDDVRDPDRAAILARRQRFIALALTGLSTTACKHNQPQPCLSMVVPDEPQPDQEPDQQEPGDAPIVEDPGAPVDSPTSEEPPPQPAPEPCLKVAAPR